MLNHTEFVDGYNRKRVSFTFDAPNAYLYASTRRLGWEWMFTGCLNLVLGELFLSVLMLVLTFTLHDFWLVLGIPAAFLGVASGSPNHSGYTKRVSGICIAAAFIGMTVGLIWFDWQSPVFLVSCVFIVGFIKNKTYHAICRKAFLRLLLTRKDVYDDAIQQNFISLKDDVNGSIL